MTHTKKALLIGLLLPWLNLTSATDTDYCNVRSCRKGMHTMCLWPTETPGSACNTFTSQGVDSEQIEAILDLHNRYRNNIADGKETRTAGGPMPQAANMGLLVWDDELARIAKRWALQCTNAHDKCRNIHTMAVGQNAAISASKVQQPNLTKIAMGWYESEVRKYNAVGMDKFEFSTEIGHFSQFVWGTTYKMGCGHVGYKGMHNGHEWYLLRLICNYGPSGNFIGWPVYQRGPPCSACPNGTTCGGDSRYPNLCKLDSDQVPEDIHGMLGDNYRALNSGSVLAHSVLAGLCGTLAVWLRIEMLP